MRNRVATAWHMTVLWLLAWAATAAGQPAAIRPAEKAEPFVRLYDTGDPQARELTAAALATKAGWTAVAEDKLDHKFAGHAVVCNDKLAVVVAGHGIWADVCSRSGGLTWRMRILPTVAEGEQSVLPLRTVENTPAAVAVESGCRLRSGKAATLRCRLTAGVPFVQVTGGEGLRQIVLVARTRNVVVPGFLADDVAVRLDDKRRGRVPLPADNCLLALLDGGAAVATVVWQDDCQTAASLEPAEKDPNGWITLATSGAKGVWISLLERERLWHEQAVPAGGDAEKAAREWRPPFPAKWRATLMGADGACRSWDPDSGSTVSPPSATTPAAAQLLIYPMDRSVTTPLTVLCPIDVMRAALGIGPCQYVLEREGFPADTPATPDLVGHWVEDQFKRKKDQAQAQAIRDRLAEMVRHVRLVQTRLGEYGERAGRLKAVCDKRKGPAGDASGAAMVLSIVADLERAARTGQADPRARAEKLAADLTALIGKSNALPPCQEIAVQLRALGTAQDAALARCRMAVRRIAAQCRVLADEGPKSDPGPALAAEVLKALEQKSPGN